MSATPPFAAYSSRSGPIGFAASAQDDPDKRLKITSAPPSFAAGDDLEEIEEKAYARLGREQDDTIYLVDGERRLVRVLSIDNRKLYESLEQQGRRQFIAWTLLVFCLISFVTSAISGEPRLGLLIFTLITLLYLGIVLTGIQNEVEGAVVCLIVLVLILLLIPAVQKVRAKQAEVEQTALVFGNLAAR